MDIVYKCYELRQCGHKCLRMYRNSRNVKSFHCYTANYYQRMSILKLMIYSFKKVIHKIIEFYSPHSLEMLDITE